MVRRHWLCVGLLLLAGGLPNQAQDPARTFLATSFKVTSAEMDQIDAGHVVVRSLGAADPREVATLGIVRIRVTPEFYALPKVWERSACCQTLKARLAFVLISKLYRQMYANTGIATDSARVNRSARWARMIAAPCRRLFAAPPMPDLQVPA